MKIIFKIALAELKKLFYSPVAWFILVIYSFQTALNVTGNLDILVKIAGLGAKTGGITHRVFGGDSGVLGFFVAYAYIYMPLITMGIMSRELSTGSIKLLYSSPITNWQIILGKYLSLMGFGLVLVGLVVVFAAFGSVTIVHADIPTMLGGLLGIYLLICAYSAIGLFVSALTSYMVVAAIGTVGIFALLNYVKGVGQTIPLVRDVTYWFSLSGRVDTFISGMITSEDVLYFFIVILLFLLFTLIKLQSGRQKVNWIVTTGKYMAVFLGAMLLGYCSALPKLKVYKDLTYTKVNTLSESSQRIIAKVPDNTVITTYTNMLSKQANNTAPSSYKQEEKLFEKYVRFNPTIQLKYVYFYHKTDYPQLDRFFPTLNDKQRLDTLRNNMDWNFEILPYSSIANQVNLSSEDYRSIRVIETPDGKKTFLRFFDDYVYIPTESEISAAFKHLIRNQPTVGFLTGQGERSISDQADEGYSIFSKDVTFRHALINQGIDIENISLDKPIGEKIRVLVIADMKSMLTVPEQKNLDNFIGRGGNMMILGEPGKQTIMNSITVPLGVRFLPGTLVHQPGALSATLVKLVPTIIGRKHFSFLDDIVRQYKVTIMPTVGGLETDNNKGFDVLPWLTTEADSCWSELPTTNVNSVSKQTNPDHMVKKQQPKVKISDNGIQTNQETKIQPTVLVNGKLMNNIAIVNPERWRIYQEKLAKARDSVVEKTNEETKNQPRGSVNGKVIDNNVIVNQNKMPLQQQKIAKSRDSVVSITGLKHSVDKKQSKITQSDAPALFNQNNHVVKKPYTTVISLDRMIGKKHQKIIVIGDADWLSNGELNTSRREPKANSTLSNAMFSWLCNGEAPVDISRPKPIDNVLKINKHSWAILSLVLKWVFPGILLLVGVIIWLRRKGR